MTPNEIKAKVQSYRRRRRFEQAYARMVRDSVVSREAMTGEIETFAGTPLISIVVPVFNVDDRWLRKCIASVTSQIYTNWELCIADDASTAVHIRPTLDELASNDARIKVVFRTENGHISAASNSALELATGEFTVFLDHDDELSEDALFWIAKEINAHPDVALIYSDEDKIDEKGSRSRPNFKPDFGLDLHYSQNTTTHISAYRTQLIRELGGLRLGFEGSQDYDLSLRVIESVPRSAIRDIPRVLYHWRSIETSVAGGKGAKPYAFTAARNALASHFERLGIDVEVEAARDNLNRVRYRLPPGGQSVSVICNSKNDIARMTDHPSVEFIECGDEGSLAERLNHAAAKATGDILCFVDSSLVPMDASWLSELTHFLTQADIGAVGGKLLRPDGSIDQTGIILGSEPIVRKAHHGYPRGHVGSFYRAALIGNYSAVSHDCMAMRRDVFEKFGGFDAVNFPDQFFDVDLCLRLGDAGLRVVYTPYAELQFPASNDDLVPSDTEIKIFKERWAAVLANDPFHNPNFMTTGDPFTLER